MKPTTDRIILGIDPGTTIMGYGLIAIKGTQMETVDLGVLHLGKTDSHALKLKKIFEHTLALIDRHKPDDLAIEAPFFGKNVQSMLKLGRAQGVAMAAGLFRTIPIFEYSPKKIKQSITGNGNASKEQVAAMLKALLHLEEMPVKLDATDGLAAAVCHFFQHKNLVESNPKKINGLPQPKRSTAGAWKKFLSDNPQRLRKIS